MEQFTEIAQKVIEVGRHTAGFPRRPFIATFGQSGIMMNQFFLEYELYEHGWATARLLHGETRIEMTASYLHDSLKQLADAAYRISRGPTCATVVFMDEPGEHQLTVNRFEDGLCHYTVDWHDDWHSWGIRTHGSHSSVRLAQAEVEARRFVQQVHSILWTLFDRFGTEGYKERWCKYEFPLKEMERLAGVPRRQEPEG